MNILPTDSAERKAIPIGSGVLDYFPAALAGIAKISKLGNDKHNPGEPLHHARGKSMDHWDCMMRHGMDRGTVDPTTGLDHVLEMAWRALALAQEIMEEKYGAPLARGARLPAPMPPTPTTVAPVWSAHATVYVPYNDPATSAKRRRSNERQVKARDVNRRRKPRK